MKLVKSLLALSLTAAVTCASWFFVERPFLRWKDRLERPKPASSSLDRPVRASAQAVLEPLES